MRRKRLSAVAMLSALALVLSAGCGSSDEDSGASSGSKSAGFDSAQFQQIIESNGVAPTAFPDLPKGPSAAKGKYVVHINCPMAAEGCKSVDDGVVSATKALGWKELTIDTGGDPKKVLSAFEQAVNTKADGILINSLDPSQIKDPVADARKAGIPVVCIGCGALKDNANPSADDPNHEVQSPAVAQGKLSAAQAVLDTKGKARVLILSLPDYAAVLAREKGAREIFEQCADCSISKTIKLTVADLATSLPAQIKAALQADPKIDTVWVGFDAGAAVANTSIQQLGRDDVFTYSNDGLKQNLAEVAKGGVQNADVVQSLPWMGWAGVDNLNRIFGGDKPLVDDKVPNVLVTRKSVDPWLDGKTGDIDYQTSYRELWGLG